MFLKAAVFRKICSKTHAKRLPPPKHGFVRLNLAVSPSFRHAYLKSLHFVVQTGDFCIGFRDFLLQADRIAVFFPRNVRSGLNDPINSHCPRWKSKKKRNPFPSVILEYWEKKFLIFNFHLENSSIDWLIDWLLIPCCVDWLIDCVFVAEMLKNGNVKKKTRFSCIKIAKANAMNDEFSNLRKKFREFYQTVSRHRQSSLTAPGHWTLCCFHPSTVRLDRKRMTISPQWASLPS